MKSRLERVPKSKPTSHEEATVVDCPHRAQHLLTSKRKPPPERDYVTEKPALRKAREYD